MTVTVYRYDDASAPDLSASPGLLISLLDACLVNGYGAKPAAGWSKEFSGTNLAAYKQGAGSNGLYLRVDNSVSSVRYSRVVMYEAMTDVNTGTNAMPTAGQISGGAYLVVSSTTDSTERPWILIADSKRFYLWIGHNLTEAQGPSASSSYQMLYFFGDLVSYKPGDSYGSALMASAAAAATGTLSGACDSLTVEQVGHYTMRDAAQNAGAIACSKQFDYYGAKTQTRSGSTSGVAYPDPVTGGFRLGRFYCSNGVATPATRGHFPGFWAIFNSAPGNAGDTFSGTGVLNGRSFILLDAGDNSGKARVAIETSDTWD